MNQTVHELLFDFDPGHSEFQIDNFIIKNQGHPWFQYKQCLREIDTRESSRIDLKDKLQINEIEIDQLSKRKKFSWGNRKRKLEIFLESKKRQREKIKKELISIAKELNRFVKLAVDIRKTFFEDAYPVDTKKLESAAWFEKAKFLMALDFITHNAITKQTMEFIFSFPAKQKAELVRFLMDNHSKKELIDLAIKSPELVRIGLVINEDNR